MKRITYHLSRITNEAPRPDGQGIFSLLLRRERNPSEAENSSHSSTSLHSWFSAKGDKGQAMVVLLFVVSIVFLLATQASILNLSSASLSNELTEGSLLLTKAEGYLENGLMQYIRNPNYAGESLQDGTISCTIQVVDGSGVADMTSTCQKDQKQRKVGATITYSAGAYSFSKIEERP